MSEGIQITIPDFDDEDYGSSTIPFGRSAGNAFGFGSSAFGNTGAGAFSNSAGGFGGSSSGQDSPTLMTPIAAPDRSEKSYFGSHNRGDSIASVDSAGSGSTRYPNNANRSTTSFALSTHSSVITPTTGFTKKPSFASFRNAFKSGKSNEPPPVPQLDNYVLKNPFNRSTSSLGNVTPIPGSSRGPISGAITTSPPFGRPPTPGSVDARHAKGSKKIHAHAKSFHSQSGSIFHASDGGSDGHGQFSSSPPPVPRVPYLRSETPPISDLEEDKVVMDPKTPSDYALHAVFIRFATSAEAKIDVFLRKPLDHDPLLPDSMGPGIDPKFDDTLRSLGQIALKHTKAVISSILRWRRSQVENVGSEFIRYHTQSPSGTMRTNRAPAHIPVLLNERKTFAAIYIMCRALIAVVEMLSKDAIGEDLGYTLESTTFDQFRKPELKLLMQSANHRTNAELSATLLGHLANIRFVSVTDRFLAELAPVTQGQVPKDLDMKYENLVQGIKHIQIKVWPSEAFEEGAEFMESLSKAFVHAHGFRLKTAFAETLIQILHPIGKTAQAETNIPLWGKAIELIYPKAREMASKPRYWNVAFPLMITSLCVAPETYFRKHWYSCFEISLSKLKEKSLRVPVLNGLVRLLWTYLYRCQESASTTTTKLDNLLKSFFPPNRLSVYPHEDHLDPFIYMVHFILSRHFDYGRDLCLDLMQESAILSAQQTKSSNIASVFAPERTTIAIQAILMSLCGIERESPTPAWPSSSDFFDPSSWTDYPTSSDFVPQSLLARPGMQDFFDRCGTVLAVIATTCGNSVGSMSMFDEQWSLARINPSYEESHNYIVRKHPEYGNLAYPTSLAPQINLLQTCFTSWPRYLHPALPVGEAIDMLLRGVIHVEPVIGEAARDALRRFLADPVHSLTVVAHFTQFLFSPARIAQEGSGTKSSIDSPQLLELWVGAVDAWIQGLIERSPELLEEQEETITQRCLEIEAGALFLISHETRSIHVAGVKVVRILGILMNHLSSEPSTPIGPQAQSFIALLHGRGGNTSYLEGYDELLDKPELMRLHQWRDSKRADVALRLADSANAKDRTIWRYVFPMFMQSCMRYQTQNLGQFRDILVAATSRCHPTISQLAGLSTKLPAGRSIAANDGPGLVKENMAMIDQWHMWVKILCATATMPEVARPVLTQLAREHSRALSDISFERERLSTSRGLFRYLTPFLDSEYTPFCDIAVVCISSFPADAYPQLLEDLSLLAGRQFYDDPRSKIGLPSSGDQNAGLLSGRQPSEDARAKANAVVGERIRRQERLHSAVARIYYLTAHFLQHQRSAGRQAALANVLKFVRTTQAFLTSPEMRDNYTLQRLRRYFCGTVERLFEGLATLEGSDRFIPGNMHLTLYRLCEEWCQFGHQSDAVKQRFILMQKSVAMSVPPAEANDAIERFQEETLMLSYAAVGALSILCQKAFSPPGVSSGSPTDRHCPDHFKPITSTNVLERLSAILSSAHPPTQERGKKALKSLLSLSNADKTLLDDAMKRAIVSTDQTDTSNGRFFEVISDIVCSVNGHGFSFAQSVCLGLSNLCHPLSETRREAFNLLEAIHHQFHGMMAMSQFEATVGSSASGTYIHSHRIVAEFLAGEHPDQATAILAQLANWLPGLPATSSFNMVIMLLLQSLEFWIPNIQLMTDDRIRLSQEGHSALYHLMALTLRYGQSHPEQVLVLWTRLVEFPNQANGHATVRFLLEQSHKVGSTVFIDSAANIVACICQSAAGRQIFEDLCSVIEPVRMLPTFEHKLNFPDAQDMELWSDLDALFVDGRPRLSLGAAQFAWLFLADVALPQYWELQEQLPTLLHSIFTHFDNRVSFVRLRARHMLFQLLRSWAPGYDELPDYASHWDRSVLKSELTELEREVEDMLWKEDEKVSESQPKMEWLCSRVVQFLEPLCPSLRENWGTLALEWGTSCTIRSTAFRSLQIFRALLPRVKMQQLALIIGRLSNTISAPEEAVKLFTTEMIVTVNAIISSNNFDRSLLPQIFWCTCAALSTTVEQEFAEAVKLLQNLLPNVDFDNPDVVQQLLVHRPLDWNGSASLQPNLLAGLRSSVTSESTFKVLQSLAEYDDGRLIDPSDGRVRDLYTLSLPWCLHSMTTEKTAVDEPLRRFAERIGELAKQEGRQSIHKIMTSFAKGHFRTKDDFLRQSVVSLREHYGVEYWTEIVTLLIGLVLNQERWLRIQAMQILKVLFQQRETRNPVELLGSELLMPLLRLLETDLASQALDVLEEPMAMSGGLAAKHVLRMSMHTRTLPTPKEVDSVATVFGVPQESGWCVVKADELREACRSNLIEVFDTCSMPSRPSRIEFEPEEVEALAESPPLEEDLGGLVQNLHDLSTFFQDNEPSKGFTPLTNMPNRRLEARVAAILAKSTAPDAVTDVPPTPFADVFRVAGVSSDEDSDDYSMNSDDELDAFYFDSPSVYRSAPNGARFP